MCCSLRASQRPLLADLVSDGPPVCDGLTGLRNLGAIRGCARWDDVDCVVEVVPEDDIQDVSWDCKEPWSCNASCTAGTPCWTAGAGPITAPHLEHS